MINNNSRIKEKKIQAGRNIYLLEIANTSFITKSALLFSSTK